MKRILRWLLPVALWEQLRTLKSWINEKVGSRVARVILKRSIIGLSVPTLQRTLAEVGYSVARAEDYYSPLPSVDALRKNRARWDRPSTLQGIHFDAEEMKILFLQLLERYLEEFSAYPPYEQLQKIGFGPGYTAVDALTLYVLIRYLRPGRYIEVGSGLSTYYASLAAEKNAAEGWPLEITCIEPNPYESLYSIKNISIIKSEVQSVDLSLYQTLQQNDILFIDSSHMLKVDSDVPYLFLEVLPRLAPGAVIHVHDVPFPYNTPYPADLWVFGQEWPIFWNEAMMLQAFLSYNSAFRIMLSTPLLRHMDEAFLKLHVPNYESVEQNPNAFSSIWLRRI